MAVKYAFKYSELGALEMVVERTDASGIVLANPVVHTPADGDWATFVAGIQLTCDESAKEWVQTLCDTSGLTSNKFQRCFTSDGNNITFVDVDFTGNPYTTQGTVGDCSDSAIVQNLCYLDVSGTTVTPFTRLVQIDPQTGQITTIGDYTQDLSAMYTVTGTESYGCDGDEALTHIIPMCNDGTQFWRLVEITTGNVLANFDEFGNSITPSGTITPGACTEDPTHIETICKVDVTASGITSFSTLVAVDPDTGNTTELGNYTPDLSGPYTPTGTVSLPGDVGSDIIGVSSGRDVLDGAGTWNKPNNLVQSISVKVLTVGNIATPPTVTDYRNVTTDLALGDYESWSVVTEAGPEVLTGDFTITSNAGDRVVITWTELST